MFDGSRLWGKKITEDMIYRKIADGVEVQTYPELPINLYQAFKTTCCRMPNKIAVIDNWGREYTYRDLYEKVKSFSAWLCLHEGIGKGTFVGVMLYNSVEFCVTFLALNRIGAVMVPFPSKYRAEEVLSLVRKSDVSNIIFDEHFKSYFEQLEKTDTRLLMIPEGEAGYALEQYKLFMEFKGENFIKENDMALLVFTSGTTARSKGVVIRNYNIMHAVVSYHRTLGIGETDTAIIPIPIYLITGLIAIFGLMVYRGGTVVLNRFFDAHRVLQDVLKYEVTFIHASPTVFSLLLNVRNEYPVVPSLRMFACGSSNMPPARIKELHDWMPDVEFRTVYGLTETTSPASIFPDDANKSIYIGSSGIPIPGLLFKVTDAAGAELPNYEQGEIWVKGTNITQGYYKITSEEIRDGWLNTGDIGYFNEKGYLYIVDRRKDMINRGGEKICSFDVENELLNIEGINDAAVVGIPDELYGEVPAAVIKLEKGFVLDEVEIQRRLRNRMAAYKIPVKIVEIDEIPVTQNMKTDKKYIKKFLEQRSTKI